MSSIQTIAGHVARAIDFLNHDDIFFGIGHPFDWNVVRLTGTEVENFSVPSTHHLIFLVNDLQVDVTISTGLDGADATTMAATIEAAVVSASSGTVSGVASAVDGHVRLTAPVPNVGSKVLQIIQGSASLGFLTNEQVEVGDGGEATPPSPNPHARKLAEAFAFKKVSAKSLVIPQPDLPAEIAGTQADPIDLTTDSTLTFKVNSSPDIAVTFTPGVNSLDAIVSRINLIASGISPLYANVASKDLTVTPNRLLLTSPTLGSGSTIEVTEANTPIGIAVQSISGTDGGAIKFRQDQFQEVATEDAFDQEARMVYITAEFKYDEVPIVVGSSASFAQIGIFTGIVPKPGYESADLLLPDQIETAGILEFLDYRRLTPRSEDQREALKLIVEF